LETPTFSAIYSLQHIQKGNEDVFISQILFNCLLNYYCVALVVISLVGHCCRLSLSSSLRRTVIVTNK